MSEEKPKAEVVFTPLPKDKKLTEMTREELLQFVESIRGAVKPKE